jgi:hypothetical protein
MILLTLLRKIIIISYIQKHHLLLSDALLKCIYNDYNAQCATESEQLTIAEY